MRGPLTIEGGRVGLFPLQQHHIDSVVLGWFQDEDWTRFFSTTFKRFDEESLRVLVDTRTGKSATPTYGIVRLRDDLLIGVVTVGPIRPVHGLSDVVTLIGEQSARGQGLAGETVCLASHLAFKDHDVRKLSTAMFANNLAARKAYASAGWFEEAELRDHLIVDEQAIGMVLMSCFPESLRDYHEFL